jgi:ribose transport system permease protein
VKPTGTQKSASWRGWLAAASPLLALIGLVIAAAAVEFYSVPADQGAFLSVHNFLNILRQSAPWGVVAIGMTFVIISGGIDLSVGSIVALAGGLGILAMNAASDSGAAAGVAAVVGVLAITGTALLLGALNGLLITVGKIAPFIATLSTLAAYRSISQAIVDGGNYSSSNSVFATLGSAGIELGEMSGRTVQLHYPVLIFFVLAILGSLLLRLTVYGLRVRAVGDNEKAAAYAALPVRWVRLVTYSLSGLTCGIAAVLIASRMGGTVSSGSTGLFYELDAIAAVVIGGTRMQGGAGRVWGTVVGVMILGVINNMLNMLGVGTYYQGLVKGGVIVAAVLVQRGLNR